MKQERLIEAPKRGLFVITGRGKQVLAKKPRKIDVKYLEQFPEFIEFRQRRKEKEKKELLMKKKYDKAVKKSRKERFKRQTKETQKRMKRTKRQSMEINREGEKNFLQKLYLRIKFQFRN